MSPNNNLDNNNVTYEETIEILNYDELQELKKKLLQKLMKNSQPNKSSVIFTINHIGTIDLYVSKAAKPGKPSYKSNVNCPLCEVTVPCTYVTYWQIGNLEKHMKDKHKEDSSLQAASDETVDQPYSNLAAIQKEQQKDKAITLDESKQKELDEVLGLEDSFEKSVSFDDSSKN